MRKPALIRFIAILTLACGMIPGRASAESFHAGVGRADITPKEPVWLAGYASRNRPSEGVAQKLFVKALAIRDEAGAVTLVVTADTIGFGPSFAEPLADRIWRELKVPRERFLLAASHSHAAPVLHGNLLDMYGMSEAEAAAVEAYTKYFQEQAFQAAKAAVADIAPVKSLQFGSGQAGFAVNRRVFGPRGVNFGVNPNGLVDHDVPVLRVEGTDGREKAILFGYACHCTTLGGDFYQVCADWAGYAQEHVEMAYPGSTALFITGCGADANPHPRGQLAHARQHGLALAGAVARALNEPMVPLRGRIAAAFDRVELPFDKLPSKEDFELKLQDKAPAVKRFAQRHIDILARGEKLMTSYPCPVQVLRFGGDLTLVALGGEVVVDYAYRLKRELPGERLWAAAYCNDVFAYVPSMRILIEGGYEAEFSQIYYGMPTRFAPAVEDILVKKAVEMVRQAGGK